MLTTGAAAACRHEDEGRGWTTNPTGISTKSVCVAIVPHAGPTTPSGPTSAIDSGRLVAAMAAAATTWIRSRPVALRKTPNAVDALMTHARSPRTRAGAPRRDGLRCRRASSRGSARTRPPAGTSTAVPPTATTSDRFNVRSAHARSPRATASVYAGQSATVTRLTAAGASIRIRYGSANCGTALAPSSCEITNASDSYPTAMATARKQNIAPWRPRRVASTR